MTFDHDLDARGLLCPLPVLKAAKRLRSLGAGQVIRLQAD
ncbi:MAG: sulfurtransferase TusA family protein, partial [Alphaproteobacteria bacterium]|nr:sulfurtransferase TusA family protein [Alphaproteobacteria bacterium]